jgi:hypothetical protein
LNPYDQNQSAGILQGKKQARRQQSAAMPTMEMGDMGSPKLKVLVVLLLAGTLNFGYWYRLDRQGRRSRRRCRWPSRRTANSAM